MDKNIQNTSPTALERLKRWFKCFFRLDQMGALFETLRSQHEDLQLKHQDLQLGHEKLQLKHQDLQQAIENMQQLIGVHKAQCDETWGNYGASLQNLSSSVSLLQTGYVENVFFTKKLPEDFSFVRENSIFYGSLPEVDIEGFHSNLRNLIQIVFTPQKADAFFIWGLNCWNETLVSVGFAQHTNKPLYLFEDGFLRSVCPAVVEAQSQYRAGIAFTVDRQTAYFDATRASDLEDMLNTREISESEQIYARQMIKKIIDNKLSKYNNQPLTAKVYGTPGRSKVLVIDQSYKDMSIVWGLGDENTFEQMLRDAVEQNPDADILVKVHPDTIGKGHQSEYFKKSAHSNVFLIEDFVSPIALLEQVDKVYVCTSQLGFEALMCGKDVHVYGMPFYAGWGLTHDKKTCARRTKTRTVEEVFYLAYIVYTWYVSPETGQRCNIEEAIDYLLKMREQYFNQ